MNEFFDAGGTIIKEKVNQLLREIDRGLWDNSLFWDIEAYQSLQSTYSLNSQISKIIQSNNVAIGSDRSTKSEESSSFES